MCRTSSQGNACNQYCVLTLTTFLVKKNLLVCARSNVTAEKFANKTSKIPLLTPLLRHKAGQEGRGEILLENSFMR